VSHQNRTIELELLDQAREILHLHIWWIGRGRWIGQPVAPRVEHDDVELILEDPGLVRATPAAGAPAQTPEQRRAAILARNNMTEQELVAGCMKNSPKWGQSECEFWAPSKRRHHPATVASVPSALPPLGELFPKITAPTLIVKADAQGDLRKQNEEIARRLPRGKVVHIEGAGHNVRRENKAQTIEVMKAFLGGT
jgi:pimeloyl-ACP methyl ester carboxylesterase